MSKPNRFHELTKQQAPAYPGFTYIEGAASRIGITVEGMYSWLRANEYEVCRKPGVRTDGRKCVRSYVADVVLQELETVRRELLPAGTITTKAAAKMLGVSIPTVHANIASIPATVPTMFRKRKSGKAGPFIAARERRAFTDKDVKAELDRRKGLTLAGLPKPSLYTDADAVVWAPVATAQKFNKAAKAMLLAKYANKWCPQIGEILVSRGNIPWPNGYRSGKHPNPMGFKIEQIRKFKRVPPGRCLGPIEREPVKDEVGTWLFPEAQRRITGLSERALRKLGAAKSCHYLDGRTDPKQNTPEAKVPLKQKRSGTRTGPKDPWLRLEDQLRTIGEKRGMPQAVGPGQGSIESNGGESPTATPPPTEARHPAESPRHNRGRRGPLRSERTKRLYAACYDGIAAGKSLKPLVKELGQQYPEPDYSPPHDRRVVSTYAHRHALTPDPQNGYPHGRRWPIPRLTE